VPGDPGDKDVGVIGEVLAHPGQVLDHWHAGRGKFGGRADAGK
jgi:hypothetical protein